MNDNKKIPPKVWIDLENSPHVPFFRPIIDEFRKRNIEVVVTSRDCFETQKLLKFFRISHTEIGKHYGKNSVKKILGLLYRTFQLCAFAKRQNFDVALCHGSRSQMITTTLLNIPFVILFDYEGSKGIPLVDKFLKVAKYMVPDSMQDIHLTKNGIAMNNVYKYPGIKEDVYLYDFKPDPDSLKALKLDGNKIIIVIRPPATQAHYHNPKADIIFEKLLKRFAGEKNTQTVLVPRTEEQKKLALQIFENAQGALTIPSAVVNGLDLLWQADLVISGGGTMVREGAGLGVPAYSIFCGKMADVDRYLESQNRLVFVRETEDIQKIKLIKRESREILIHRNNLAPLIVEQTMRCV
ncbi:MAG: DUF354 domain-containing protein [Pseudomonadota bacterium]